ncbi:AAA family ATPase [Mesorhizobium sp. M0011]|uniref:trifunctional serine/threonine-protein kinase/ATP-binding protein/sensor histidine kinase n=1 Tax=Mesorhizobium sp. M0011 TaxID=2956839 RepID=UPI00333DAFB5
MTYSGYVFEVVSQTGNFVFSRGTCAGKPPVLALSLGGQQPSARNLERLSHELALAADLDRTWAVRPLAITRQKGRQMLVLEDCGGEPLNVILAREQHQMNLTQSFQIAIDLARAVGQAHKSDLIHKDIKPANVFVDNEGHVRLTGFGIASRLRRERQMPGPPEVIAGTFAYMAPEQTGRMNRSLDSRSDLYSLGVTLYELFTGELPFTAADPMEWIHCHIARIPLPPSQRMKGLPLCLDDLILKLLAKDPEERYRTAAGVEADLVKCLEAWACNGSTPVFELGENDVSDRLLLPERLYGRDAEVGVLLAASDRVMTRGTCEMVLITGYAGIGKSSVVNELHKSLVPRRGLFASGKSDQYKRNIPYATLAQALQGLFRQLLIKSDTELRCWRDNLLAALGSNGQLMVDLIPELALIIGEQPTIAQVDAKSARTRFHLAFRNLLGVFAKAEHPLVLFIDDLHWLDTGTLELLEGLVTDPRANHILVVGAYRTNEVGPTHPLFHTLGALRSVSRDISEVLLGPLQVGDLAQLCADALHSDVEQTRELAGLIFEKTGGNPFFALQFLTALAEEGLLTFQSAGASWRWDIDRVRAKGITDNVGQLLSTKLTRYSAGTQRALGQLACLGHMADRLTVACVQERSVEQVDALLAEAVQAGLIHRFDGTYAFSHDRVHEAAYALIPPAERAATHLRIGRALLAQIPPEDLEEKVFEIANQFHQGSSAIAFTAERDLAAQLHLIAGKRAQNSSAYRSAQTYFAAGRSLLEEGSWERHYKLTFDLELGQAECEIVGGELIAAEDRIAVLTQHAAAFKDEADVVCLAVLLYFTTGRSESAVEVALAFLSRKGINWSSRPTEEEVRREYLEMRRQLARRPVNELIDLPAMSDPDCIAIMAVLTELFPAAYAVDRYLLEIVLLRMTNLSLEHGHCQSSSVAYSALNMTLGSHFSDYATAYNLGQLACQLVDRRSDDRFKARVYSCFAAFAMPWFKPLPICQPLMRQAFEIGRSMGDMAFAAYNSRNLITHLLVSGLPLSQVQIEADQALAFASTIQLGLPADRFLGQLSLIRNLRGAHAGSSPEDEEWANQNVEAQPQLAMMVCYYWVFRLQERFFLADYAAALEASAKVAGIRWAMRSSIEEAEYDFYSALTCAAAIDGASDDERKKLSEALSKHYDQIVLSAENCQENFSNRKALVGAEIARLEGREVVAQHLYEDAVRLAREYGFVQNEGLANELAGQFHAARGLETISDAYLRNAVSCYERWGGHTKIRQIKARYPNLSSSTMRQEPAAMIDAPRAQMDDEAVDNASQTLSAELVLPTLLGKLMRLAVEHAGAERGLLVLMNGNEPRIEAQATTTLGNVDVQVQSVSVSPSDLPASALHYVLRTRERLVLDDASSDGLDSEDEYVSLNRPRSVLCLPIFKQKNVIGALYLENNLTPRAFTSDRVAVLDFLASQAAIWLENAQLYSNLRRSETWLREAQHLSSTGSFYWRVDLDTVEFSDQTFRIYDLEPGNTVTLEMIATRIHPEDHALLQEMIDIARGPATDLDYRYRAQMPDASVKHLHLVAHGARNKDGHVEYIGAIHDVTHNHLADEAIGKARSELAHVARITTLGVLTASIAHEVSQPLMGIVTNAATCLRMLASDPPNIEGARRTAQRSIRDGHRAADVIKRLRALFGKKGTTTESVDLNDATREVIALSSTELQRSRVVLQTDFARDLPSIMGDRVQLQQVMLNLLLNASDAMSHVEDRPRKLTIRTELDDADCVRLIVKDTGAGFDPLAVEKLFEAFYTTKNGGMGMGLSVSRSIIESHLGRLWAAGNDGPGSTFSFSIPQSLELIHVHSQGV